MSAENVAVAITVIAMSALFVLGSLFLLLAVAGRILTNKDDRIPLGNALGHVSIAAGVLMLSFAGFMAMRLYVGPSPAPLEPEWLYLIFRVTLVMSALWCLIAAGFAFPYLISHLRKRPETTYEINQAAIFGTLAKALPVIVSNHLGVIQHTTAEFDTLTGALPGYLVGKSLEIIMPERYHAGHHHGMARYMETREPHIIGTVVPIEMRRIDGVEVPVYLALNTIDVNGKPWYVASIWPRALLVAESLPPVGMSHERINLRQDVRETEQNVREVFQDDRSTLQDRRGVVQDQRQATADQRQVTADDRDVTADARDITAHDRDVTADDRDITAHDRDVTADDRDTVACARDVTADDRDIDQDARTVSQNALQVVLDNGQVVPFVIDTSVSETIEHTAVDVAEVKIDVKEVQRQIKDGVNGS